MPAPQVSPNQTPSSPSLRWAYCLGLATRLLLCALGIAGLLWLMGGDIKRRAVHNRGQESGLRRDQPALDGGRWAVNVALEQYKTGRELLDALELAQSMGFGAIRQRLAWAEIEPAPGVYDWAFCDQVVSLSNLCGLDMIAVLDMAPAWARADWEQDNPWAPPTHMADYARFVGVLAERYGGQIMAYQIWDNPNIAPYWGKGPIDPKAYVALLEAASAAIRQADSAALIITAGLAPNTESGGLNMSDVMFLHEIYRRGAGDAFDVVGAKAFGFWSGPDDRRVSEDVLNFSRVILLRQEMLRRGEGHKPIWALESGWYALPADWQGRLCPQGSDVPFVQGERTTAALKRVQQEWPWMSMVCLPSLQPNAALDDPAWGLALTDPDQALTPLGECIKTFLADDTLIYPGRYLVPDAHWVPHARIECVDLYVWGSTVILGLAQSPEAAGLEITIEGAGDSQEFDLYAEKPKLVEVTIAHHLPPEAHRIRLYGSPEALALVHHLYVGHRPDYRDLTLILLSGLLAVTLLWEAAGDGAALVPWSMGWYRLRGAYHRHLGLAYQVALMASGAALALAAPLLSLRLIGLGFILLTALFNPDLSLLLPIALLPLAPLQVNLGGLYFAGLEVALWVAVGGFVWNLVLGQEPLKRVAIIWHDICLLDGVVLALVLMGLLSALWAEYRHVALREWRTVLLGSAGMYALMRISAPDRRRLLVMIDVALLSSAGMALYALLRYPTAVGVIEAEGVRRARAFYGSPNNLALYLERMLPVALAMLLAGRTRWRRWLYGVSALLMAGALVLTFSRGALLLGLPVALMIVLLSLGRRARWSVLALVVILAALIVPLTGTERFTSLLDLEQGTTALRLSLWRSSWKMATDHPWLGVGPDNFLYYYGDYILPAGLSEPWLSHPHNLLLDFWLRLGLGGLVTFLLLLVGMREAWHRARQQETSPDHRAVLTGLLAGTAAGLAHGMIDTSFFVIELAYWFMFALAWIVSDARLASVVTSNTAPSVDPATYE